MSIQPCKACFIAQISNCLEQLDLKLNLGDGVDILWQLTDRLGNIWTGEATTNNAGEVIVPADPNELPQGLFTPYGGTYKLELFDTDKMIIHYVIDDVDYDCIQFTVAAGTLVDSSIPSPNRVISGESSSGPNYLILD